MPFRPTQVLTDDQSAWIKARTDQIYELIRETPPDGAKFAATVTHMLEREEHWNAWKNDGCPDFEKKPEEGETRKPRRWVNFGCIMSVTGCYVCVKLIDLTETRNLKRWVKLQNWCMCIHMVTFLNCLYN